MKIKELIHNEIFVNFMENLLVLIAAFLVLTGCGTAKYVVPEAIKETKIEIRDSIVYRDSVVYIPQERIVEVVPQLDTLKMEIEVAQAQAYLDTANMILRGELKSKKEKEKIYIERIEYKERTDTVYVERPVPYEVVKKEPYIPTFFKFTALFFIGAILLIIIRIVLKFKGL